MKVRLKNGGPLLGEYYKTVKDKYQVLWYVVEDAFGNLSIHSSGAVEFIDDTVIPKELLESASPAPSLSTFYFVFRETYSKLLQDHDLAARPTNFVYALVERARQVADVAARANGEFK